MRRWPAKRKRAPRSRQRVRGVVSVPTAEEMLVLRSGRYADVGQIRQAAQREAAKTALDLLAKPVARRRGEPGWARFLRRVLEIYRYDPYESEVRRGKRRRNRRGYESLPIRVKGPKYGE